MRYFNTEGLCIPNEHYMVRLDDRVERIKRLYVDRRKYFVINRGRQYGKTTTLKALAEYLQTEYRVISMDFQGISTKEYADEFTFVTAFMRMFAETFEEGGVVTAFANGTQQSTLGEMFYLLSEICKTASKPIVLMIDEVDSASNNQVFIDFLAQLRRYYLNREKQPTFHSVILAGLYDIKYLKLKIRPDSEHQYNSPWNIAAEFKMDMNFSEKQIAVMLEEYEADSHTGMDVDKMAEEIYQYTDGYPYLVSVICKYLDEEVPSIKGFECIGDVWTKKGIEEAVKRLLNENTSLFDSMIRQMDLYKDLREIIERILYQGRTIPFSPAEKSINLGVMFGFLKEENGHVAIANRIFEMYLMNMFIAQEAINSDMFLLGQGSKTQFTTGQRLNMDLVLKKFVEHFHDIYGDNDEKFIEAYGRKFFLLYLKPIINGTGNYYLEAQTRDAKRTDVVVDYLGEQFIVEMKIWYGNEYNERGERQLAEYLDYFHLDKGYMISFNFNKKKEIGVKELRIEGKTIIEAVV